ncbi:MAG: PilW family protein, partial [Gammaproteobacteria bacterium]|nr:PilW family protein [Gammaproteobacteria bacterium]
EFQQRGFTIVEIMLAITLSLILIAGVLQIYLSSKESFRIQSELARLQENQRIALEFLQRDISKTGFVPYNGNPVPGPAITVTDGGGNNSDTISVSYTFATDCLGAPAPDGFAVNNYFIDPNTLQLMCLGNGGAVAQPIADGIENMQILVGEDNVNNSTIAPSADRYVNPSTAGITKIVSVRIALLTRSSGPIKKQATLQNITLLDANVAPNDRLKRQVVTTTIPLRNA